VIEFLLPENRKEVLIGCAAIALHGLLASGLPSQTTPEQMEIVANAFNLAREFLKQAERVQP
jgi:hypothetical protein